MVARCDLWGSYKDVSLPGLSGPLGEDPRRKARGRVGGPRRRRPRRRSASACVGPPALELGESPGWVATQLGHTNAEMVYRRYHRFIPNLRGRDGALAAKGLADEGL